jgi:hypothetical protein
MAEDALLKFAQPVLIGIGLIVVLNLWNIVNSILSARKSKDRQTEEKLDQMNASIIKIEYRLDTLTSNVNDIGKMIKNLNVKR